MSEECSGGDGNWKLFALDDQRGIVGIRLRLVPNGLKYIRGDDQYQERCACDERANRNPTGSSDMATFGVLKRHDHHHP
jgi:hypothetical protein